MSDREAIRADLLDQLERNGTVGKHYTDLVEDYMRFWDVKTMLQEDIETRGVVVIHTHDRGTKTTKKNDSVTELVKVNDRMVKLLDAIGIKPADQGGGADDEM